MKRLWKEKGQSVTEFALLLPILLIVLAGVLDLGRLYFAYIAITDAAAEGATYAAVHPADTTGITGRAQDATGGLVQLEEDSVNVSFPSGVTAGQAVVVEITYDFSLATPFMNVLVPEGAFELRAVATEVILYGEV